MKKHWTQTTRGIQMETLKKEIVRLGGWIKIQHEIGESEFAYYIAGLLGCQRSKARSYIDQIVKGSQARAKIDKYLADLERKKEAAAVED